MTRARNFTAHRGQSVVRVLGINYNLAFKILGPTPRVQRKEVKRGGHVKFPDAAVREVRELQPRMGPSEIARTLEKKYPGVNAEWCARVMDGTIRGGVK